MVKFDKDKYLKKLRFKKYKRYLYIGIPCILVLLIGIYFAYSKFSVSKEEEVVRTTVGEFIHGDVVIGAYIDGEYSKSIPGKNDGYIVDKIACDTDTSASWDNNSWGIVLTNLSKRTKCNVYFKKNPVSNIIAQLDTSGKCPTMNADGSVNVTEIEATNGYLCKAKDAYGDSYYYRGNVTNNYVEFAGFYWRIVRINGDGTVRVIYDGTSAHANGEASEDRQIGKSAFNSSYNDNAYVGYMYGQTGASTYATAHANTNNSTIKTYIDNWYKTNIVGTTNEQYLADNVFCNDRSISSHQPRNFNYLGYGTNKTAYHWYWGPWEREYKYNDIVLLTCPQKNDAFTVSDTTNGNGALTYPVGLLSTDEIVLAGGWNDDNSGYYLYSGQVWWASSPLGFMDDSSARVRRVLEDGCAGNWDYLNGSNYVSLNRGVRPVFNLKAEVLAQGSGTASDPYRISLTS